jgi:hypothetical protein
VKSGWESRISPSVERVKKNAKPVGKVDVAVIGAA